MKAECPPCDGSGKIVFEGVPGYTEREEMDCYLCRKTGRVPAEAATLYRMDLRTEAIDAVARHKAFRHALFWAGVAAALVMLNMPGLAGVPVGLVIGDILAMWLMPAIVQWAKMRRVRLDGERN